MCVTYQFGLTRTTAVIVVRYLSTGRMCGNLNRCQRPKALHDLHVQNSSMRSKNFVFRCTSPCVGRNISMIPVDGGTTNSKAITPQFASVQKVYFRLFIMCLSMLWVWLMGVMRDNGSIDRPRNNLSWREHSHVCYDHVGGSVSARSFRNQMVA